MSDNLIRTPDATFRPWTDGHAVGYEVELPGGRITYVYLNPSESYDASTPDVFLYQGDEGDPALDTPIVFTTLDA